MGLSTGAKFTRCASVGNTVRHMSYGGGFVGAVDGDESTFTNCYVADCSIIGRSTGNGLWSEGGAFLGASQSQDEPAVLENCHIYDCTSTVSEDTQSSHDIVGIFAAYDGDVNATNCYYFDESGAPVNCSTVVSMTKEQFASGEVAYLLQEAQTDGNNNWGQLLTGNPEAYPLLQNPYIVYKNRIHTCIGTEKYVYSNSAIGEVYGVHDLDETGECRLCYQKIKYCLSIYVLDIDGNRLEGEVEGNGLHDKGESVTLVCPDIKGYEFVGWYLYDASATNHYDRNVLSGDTSYDCYLEKDISYAAVYRRSLPLFVAGEGNGTWLSGVSGEPDYDGNRLTQVENGIYTIRFDWVQAGSYSFKFTDGTWDNTWGVAGGAANVESGVETEAAYGEGSGDICFSVPADEASVVIKFDAGNYSYETNEGAKFTVTVVTYDENGFGSDGSYQPALFTTSRYDVDEDGTCDEVYEIGNAGQLYWFAALVNGGNTKANAVLTADIVVNDNVLDADGNLAGVRGDYRSWTPIACLETYDGIFDGRRHTVSGLYFGGTRSDDYASFIGAIGNAAVVKNLGIVDSYFAGYLMGAGICGYNYGTIKECYSEATIKAYIYVGGICGRLIDEGAKVINCYNTGSVSGTFYVGGISGSNIGSIEKCYSVGSASGKYDIGEICGENNAAITDGFYLSDTDEGGYEGCVPKTAEQFESGEVAYLLQLGGQTDVWGQTIGADTYPVFGGSKVYMYKKYTGCEENDDEIDVIKYANEQRPPEFTHTLVKQEREEYCTTEGHEEYWLCSVCGKMFSDEDGKQQIDHVTTISPAGHQYSLSVSTSADKKTSSIIYTCRRANCDENTEGHRITVTLTAPDESELVYDGLSKAAGVEVTPSGALDRLPDIVYSGDTLFDAKPKYVGTYTASITLGEGEDALTAEIEYTIKQGRPDIGQVEAEPIKDTLDVDSVKLSRTDTTVDGVLKLKQGTELKYGTNVYTCVFEPADENYRAIEEDVTITVLDTIAPTASYKLGVDNWKKFVNALTFGEFCKDYLTVEISYSDKAADGETDGSGVAKKQYYISDKILNNPETTVTAEQWKDYDGIFNLDADGTYFIYVRVADNAGNEVILNSEGVVI